MNDVDTSSELEHGLLNRSQSNECCTEDISTNEISEESNDENIRKFQPAVEITFQAMMQRKLLRKIWGTYERDKPWTMTWALLTLLLIVGAAGASFQNGDISIKVNTGMIGYWSLVSLVTFGVLVYTLTKVIVVIRWMLYWLLLAGVLNLLFNKEYNLFGEKSSTTLLVLLGVVEFLTLSAYLFANYFYPRLLGSRWFRDTIGAQRWWQVRSIGPWTLTYSGVAKQHRSTCTYRGQTTPEGLPHGYGHWMDDSYHGEILTGWWENGIPVGPFRSREFGSGYAFDNVMIGYVIATDDDPQSYRSFPSNTRPPRCGVATVECSVSGGFFAHLPKPRYQYGPYVLDTQRSLGEHDTVTRQLDMVTIKDCMDHIRHLSNAHPLTNIEIMANEDRGLTVAGHIYQSTGKSYSKSCKQLVIDVVPRQHVGSEPESTLDRPFPHYRSSLQFAEFDTVTEGSLETSEQNDEDFEDENITADTFRLNPLSPEFSRTPSSVNSETPTGNGENKSQRFLLQSSNSNSSLVGLIPHGFDETNGHFQPIEPDHTSRMHLRVRGWRSTLDGHAEALVFVPGFNASLEDSLERLGQFLAMAHLPPHIKPFVFNWPAGQIATYLWAVESAASARTVELFEAMIDGLYDAGIRDVHFLCHSMGVQCLMAAFANREDGTRSSFSSKFMLAPDVSEDEETTGTRPTQLLRCRTITLLNPDYPLAAFVRYGFETIRLVCNHVTIIGNREDVALYWSEMINGMMNTIYAYFCSRNKYPAHMRVLEIDHDSVSSPRDADSCCPECSGCCMRTPPYLDYAFQGSDRLWSKQLSVGKQIYSLFAPSNAPKTAASVKDTRPLFRRFPQIVMRMRRDRNPGRLILPKRLWFDLDAIDTTWMETNVHAMRHNYFNLNPVLVEDLAELITTGRRAAQRATLLHREGNIFSYCQAPACVVNKG